MRGELKCEEDCAIFDKDNKPQTMVVGNGLVARAFKQFSTDDTMLIFASGVSNSSERESESFEREQKLIESLTGTLAHFVYFSTVSCYDPSLQNSAYVVHKRKMEQIIPTLFDHCTILRLPNLVGKTDNPHTLTNYIWNHIQAAKPLPVYMNACRYLLDIDDVVLITQSILKNPPSRQNTMDVVYNNQIRLPALVSLMEVIAGKPAKIIEENIGSCYQVVSSVPPYLLAHLDLEQNQSYNDSLLRKYYGNSLSSD